MENEQKSNGIEDKLTLEEVKNNTSDEYSHVLFRHKKLESENSFVLPIVYNSGYDVHFFNLEKFHPFDCHKWSKIANCLITFFKETHQLDLILVSPIRPIQDSELRLVHTEVFIHSINTSRLAIVKATESPVMTLFPMCLIKKKLLKPFKWQVAGSILTAYLALKFKYSINIGGGFHHCSSKKASGFCLFADISLMYTFIWKYIDNKIKVLIVDLDAHQGNGHELDAFLLSSEQRKFLMILDIYNYQNYPGDEYAKTQIDIKVELRPHTKDNVFLEYLRIDLEEAIEEFQPNLIIYNAGADVLMNDPLGGLDLTSDGVIRRDEMVFRYAKKNNISVAMLTSGGYHPDNSQLISDSIKNLFAKGYINRINLVN